MPFLTLPEHTLSPRSARPLARRTGVGRRWLTVALVSLISAGALPRPAASAASDVATHPRAKAVETGGPFELVDHTGRTVTEADFHGRYMLIYFGYMYCPDICVTALNRNAAAIDLLGDEGDRIVPVFISIDPDRDKPREIGIYAAAFHPRLVGLGGSPEQVAAAAKAYRVYYAKRMLLGDDEDNYSVDHSSTTYFMGPDGDFVGHFFDATSPEDMADRLRSLMRSTAREGPERDPPESERRETEPRAETEPR